MIISYVRAYVLYWWHFVHKIVAYFIKNVTVWLCIDIIDELLMNNSVDWKIAILISEE